MNPVTLRWWVQREHHVASKESRANALEALPKIQCDLTGVPCKALAICTTLERLALA